ncbi:TIR domain-containing protein [Citrobacter amalonaticus]|uniref:TIR domain-containing protein n=1 Tax=Citrobacter amalonaticus TaxID=35703 RepID=UPI001905096E|nr:TIR domain-containing protein [Citrobacter amalonaticus]MBJ9256323.1 TIR domain-containing protein [Citrobacter amalonaticus]
MAKKVFFSFHYQDVVEFRANVVRKHWVLKSDREEAGFFDKSIWEENKKDGDIALKKMINKALEYTSNTVVLTGTETFERPWVRYEIMKSFLRGNHLLVVHINNINGKDGKTKPKGRNPLEYVAACFSADGKTVTLKEYTDGNWVEYKKIDGKSTHTCSSSMSSGYESKAIKLSSLYLSYDWMLDEGYKNFSSWLK